MLYHKPALQWREKPRRHENNVRVCTERGLDPYIGFKCNLSHDLALRHTLIPPLAWWAPASVRHTSPPASLCIPHPPKPPSSVARTSRSRIRDKGAAAFTDIAAHRSRAMTAGTCTAPTANRPSSHDGRPPCQPPRMQAPKLATQHRRAPLPGRTFSNGAASGVQPMEQLATALLAVPASAECSHAQAVRCELLLPYVLQLLI
jgi:hypothetical protein